MEQSYSEVATRLRQVILCVLAIRGSLSMGKLPGLRRMTLSPILFHVISDQDPRFMVPVQNFNITLCYQFCTPARPGS